MADDDMLLDTLKRVAADLHETRRGWPRSNGVPADRHRGHGLPVPGRCRTHRRDLWRAGRRRGRRHRGFPARTGAGTWRRCTTPIRRSTGTSLHPKRRIPVRRQVSSTRRSSGSARARRWRWIRSSGFCWRPPGRRIERRRDRSRPRCGAATRCVRRGGQLLLRQPVVRNGRRNRRLRADRNVAERHVGPRRLCAGSAGSCGVGGHGVFVVVGGHAFGGAGVAFW